MSYFVGVDAGTSGATVIITREDGQIVGTGSSSYVCNTPQAGWVEQDMELVWSGVVKACKAAIASASVSASDIASISVASQRGTIVPVDSEWNPLCHALVWSDRRASQEARFLKSELGEENFATITGATLSSVWSCAKIRWFLDNRSDLVRKTALFVNGQEWILRRLGATRNSTDPSSISMNGMMDISQLDWSDRILGTIGISRDQLPLVEKSTTPVGEVCERCSAETGFKQGTPLFLGGGDQQCSAVGAGVVSPGQIALTLGTGAVFLARADSLSAVNSDTLIIGGHVFPGSRDLEGIVLSAGNCVRYWHDIACTSVGNRKIEASPYAAMDREAALVPAGSRGLLFLPYLFGRLSESKEITPECGFIGLSSSHRRPEMTRSVLEGVALELSVVLDEIRRHLNSDSTSPIRISGGGTKSSLWIGILAAVLNTPLELLTTTECTAFGAAILGAVGVGAFPSIEAASSRMVNVSRNIIPDVDDALVYADVRENFISRSRRQAG